MPGILQGKVTLVTGATRGIGRGIAIGLGEAGAIVYITGRSLDSGNATDSVAGGLLETQEAVVKAGGTCIAVPTDHKEDEQVRSLFTQIDREQNGQLHLLVNNAYGGVRSLRESQGKSFWEVAPSIWDDCNEVGLRSHYVASVFASQIMTKRRQGIILTISSWGGLASIFGVAYGTGKSACDRLSAEMSLALRPFNVASISLWPGIVGTEHFSQLVAEYGQEKNSSKDLGIIQDRFNWETPLLVGRVIARLLADPKVMERTGKVQIVAELADYYGITDEYGCCPASLRSLRFLIPIGLTRLKPYARFIPDMRVPWWILLLSTLLSPKI